MIPGSDPTTELLQITSTMPATRVILEAVLEVWPDHARYATKSLSIRDQGLLETTELLSAAALTLVGERLPEVAHGYRWTCDRLREEELYFHRNEEYRLKTFAEADAEVYSNTSYMEKYVDGLLLTQVLWYNHVASFHFFLREIPPRLRPEGRYLEIGPGHGLMMYLALREFGLGRSTAWDLSRVSIDQTRAALAKLGFENAEFAVQDLATVEPSDETYDLVVLSEVLEHLEDPHTALERVRPLVEPDGGLLFVNVPLNSPSPDHIYLLRTPEEARSLLTDSGFEVLHEAHFATQGTKIERALRNKVSVAACMLARRAS